MKKFFLYFLIVFSIVALVGYIAWFPSPLESSYKLKKSWGKSESEPGALRNPGCLFVFTQKLFVCDTDNSRILVFNHQGDFLHHIGSHQEHSARLTKPVNITSNGEMLLVLDAHARRVYFYALDGKYVKHVNLDAMALDMPTGLAVDKDGNLYISDVNKHLIVKYSASGEVLRVVGAAATDDSHGLPIRSPKDIELDDRGYLYVTSNESHRIQVFDNNLQAVFSWGGPFAAGISGPFNSWFNTPSAIASGPSGNIYVVDSLNDRIQKFLSNGTFANSIDMQQQQNNNKSVEGSSLVDVSIDQSGRVYVYNIAQQQVQIWERVEK